MKKLIILHGALGSKTQFEQLAGLLGTYFEVHTPDFDGHGSKSASQNAYSMELFAQNLADYMQANGIKKPLVFGYSMGGFVALKLESMHPGSLEELVTLGTKFDWSPESAEKEVKMLNAEKIEEKVPAFAAYLKSLHGEQEWKNVQNQLTDSVYREVENWQHPINLVSPEELAQQLLSLYLPG